MKLGLMQPYFFPYIGYFELINRCDKWVVFDTVQYINRGWMNRNRILHPANSEWQYVIAPLQKHPREALIKDVSLLPGREWKDRILAQLAHYKKHAPYYEATIDLVRKALAPEEESLSRLNVHAMAVACEYLDIRFRYEYLSEMDLELGSIEGPDDWGLRVSQAVGADTYINPPGGAAFYDRSKYESGGVDLVFQEPIVYSYACKHYDHVPGLSIIDVCMWNSPKDIKGFLEGRTSDVKTPQPLLGALVAVPDVAAELIAGLLEYQHAIPLALLS